MRPHPFVLLASAAAFAPTSAQTIPIDRPTPFTVVVPTNGALLRTERGGVAVQYRVKHFRGMPALLYWADLWMSLRPAGDDQHGVVHFVYKGKGTSRDGKPSHEAGDRVISKPVPAGILTCVFNYEGDSFACHVNGQALPRPLRVPRSLVGSAVRTLTHGVPGAISTAAVALSAEPFSPTQLAALSEPATSWHMTTNTTLLMTAPTSGQATLGSALVPADQYQAFLSRPRPSRNLYVNTNCGDASDEHAGTDPLKPLKTISAAAQRAVPNATIWVRKGLYAESVYLSLSGQSLQAPITLRGWPDEENDIVLSGADRVAGWERVDDGVWRKRNWPVQWIDWGRGHPGWESGKPPFDPVKRWRRSWQEHLFLDGRDLLHVPSYRELVAMSFTVDRKHRVCYLKLADGVDPNGAVLEASRRNDGIRITGDYVIVTGLTAEKFTQCGVQCSGMHCRVENVTSRANYDGVGLSGSRNVYRNIRAVDNGRCGLTGTPRHCLIEDCALLRNNTKGITQSFHAGGMKLCCTGHVTVRRTTASYNRGGGIWFDIDNTHTLIESCRAIGNAQAGLFIEISNGPCWVRGNFAAHNSTGITIAESDDCTVTHNTCVHNARGFALRYGDRPRAASSGYEGGQRVSRPAIDRKDPQGAYTVRNLKLSHNLLAFNTQVQIDGRGWRMGTWRDPEKNGYESDHNHLWAGSPKAALIAWETGLVTDLAQWDGRTRWETSSIVADPKLMSNGPYDALPKAKTGAGALWPRLHEVWGARELGGQGEHQMFPDPD